MLTERLESMSPCGFLRLQRQDDGDIVITVGEGDGNDGCKCFATVEFCTPFGGGGGSEQTWAALVQLAAAMAADNLDELWGGRRPPGIDDDQQREFVRWGKQCSEVDRKSQDS